MGLEMGSFKKAKVARLSDPVNYQKGSVVSRTIVDGETGTVTLFAFDVGQGLSEHTVPFDALAPHAISPRYREVVSHTHTL
jgi:quercetin dioxygenase-like cupin family protein